MQARPTYKSLLQFSHLFGCRLSEDQLSPGPAVPWTSCPLDQLSPGPAVPWTSCPLDQMSPGPAVPWTRCPSQTRTCGPRTRCPRTRTRCAVATQEVGTYMTGHHCSFVHRLFRASRGEEYSLGINPSMMCFKVQSRDHYAGVSTRVYLRHHMQSTNTVTSHTRECTTL